MRTKTITAISLAVLLTALLAIAVSAGAAPKERTPQSQIIPNHYIVVLKDSVDHPGAVAEAQTEQRDGELGFVYRAALKGYSAELSKEAVEALRKDPRVKYVVPDQKVEALSQTVPTGIQRSFTTENEVADIDGEDTRVDADVAVIDTGIDAEHPDLNVVGGTDCVPGSADGSLNAPYGVALDPEGDLWVADYSSDRIQQFGPEGEYISKFGSRGSEPGQLIHPQDVAIDAEGDVWVAESGNARIDEFSPAGELLQTFGGEGNEPGEFKYPKGIALDAEGNVWVADSGNGRIQEFSPAGELLQVVGTQGIDPGELNGPSDLAFDSEGNAWVTDTGNDRVEVFDPEGEYLFEFREPSWVDPDPDYPWGVAIDPEGNAWVVDNFSLNGGVQSVQKFNSEGEYLEEFGEEGSGAGQFGFSLFGYGPRGIAVDPEGSIFVADTINHRVQKWSPGTPPSFSLAFGTGCFDGAGSDGNGHGTHVAGTIGAIDNGEGVVGVAPGARLWAVRVLDDNGNGAFSTVIAGVNWVTIHAAQIEVANMSLGGPQFQPLEEAIEGSIDASVVYAVAAGNEADDAKYHSPADTPGAITVAALADTDGEPGGTGPANCYDDRPGVERTYEDDSLAWFSNYGEGVDIAAPGGCILSTLPGGEYGTISGTSMAAPHVAGAAALLASQSNPEDGEDVEAIRDELVEGGSLAYRHNAPGPPSPLLYAGSKALTATEAITGGTTKLLPGSATVTGGVNPRGLKTTYVFEYGTTTAYGKSAPVSPGEVGASAGFTRVSQSISGLQDNTTYHFRIVATNTGGTHYGHDETFTTPAAIKTTLATGVNETKATFNAGVLEEFIEGTSPDFSFEYGMTTAYGKSAPGELVEAEEEDGYGSHRHVAGTVSGLSKATVYHYRAVLKSSEGTFYGPDRTFRTAVWTHENSQESASLLGRVLRGISCISNGNCMAVGDNFGGDSLAEHWDGKKWTTLSVSATEQPDGLADVSCASASFCMAVGSSGPYWTTQARTLRWDGSKWTAISAPAPGDATKAELLGIDCTSASACVAVGEYQKNSNPNAGADYLAMRWDGKEWTLLPLPETVASEESGSVYLFDVSCLSSSDCYAVGDEQFHWDGENWTLVPNESGRVLRGVSCVSTDWCMGVGWYANAEIWDGESWTQVSTGEEVGKRPYYETLGDSIGGTLFTDLVSVSCAAEWSCVAVGSSMHHVLWLWDEPVALRWNGWEWATDSLTLPTAVGPEDSWFGSVSCISVSECKAVGMQIDEWESQWYPLIEGYSYAVFKPTVTTKAATSVDHSRATLNATIGGGGLNTTYQFEYDTSEYKTSEGPHGTKAPAPPKGAGAGTENTDVSQVVEGLKAATTYHYRVVATNAEGTTYGEDRTFSTGEWSLKSTPNPPLPPNKAQLNDVSCFSSSLCMAVGADDNSGTYFGRRWNGSEWKADVGLVKLEGKSKGIACPATDTCLAVGQKSNAASIELWADFGGWGIGEISAPIPSGATSSWLNDVSCSSETACTAVGAYTKEGTTMTLAIRLTSSEKWEWSASLQTTPEPDEWGNASLADVSCPTATSCTAVGDNEGKTFAERWNGSSWSLSSTPNPEGAQQSYLRGVSCSSASACTAVGSYGYEVENEEWELPEEVQKALALRWNGTSWSIQSTPVPSGSKGMVQLQDVACTSSTACLAVGSYASAREEFPNFPPTEEKTLAMSWNGSEWAVQSTPNLEGVKLPRLSSVSCSSSTACSAVGVAWKDSGAERVTLGERWNGSSWSLQTTPNPPLPPNKAQLNDVSCFSSSLCMAVGADDNSGTYFGRRWNGSEWKADVGLVKLEGKSKGIACPATDTCLAVGQKSNAASIELWADFGGWGIGEISAPIPSGATSSWLNDVSCSSETACTAVGAYTKEGTTMTLAIRLTSSEKWEWSASLQTTPEPDEWGNASLVGVSCPTSTSCIAVGTHENWTFAERWDGSKWSVTPWPDDPPIAESIALRSVSCTSASSCIAVGSYGYEVENKEWEAPEEVEKALVQRWDGTDWSNVSTPVPSGSKGMVQLQDVACTSSTACLAVGSYVNARDEYPPFRETEERTLAMSWNGSEWAVQTTPNLEGVKLPRLSSVSCSSSTACSAVGVAWKGTGAEERVTLGERYE